MQADPPDPSITWPRLFVPASIIINHQHRIHSSWLFPCPPDDKQQAYPLLSFSSVLSFCSSTILTRYCHRSNRPICQLPTLSCSNSNRALALTLWKTCVHFDLSQDGVGKSIQMLIISTSRLVLVCWPSKTIVSIPNPRNHTSIRQLVEQITRTKEFR